MLLLEFQSLKKKIPCGTVSHFFFNSMKLFAERGDKERPTVPLVFFFSSSSAKPCRTSRRCLKSTRLLHCVCGLILSNSFCGNIKRMVVLWRYLRFHCGIKQVYVYLVFFTLVVVAIRLHLFSLMYVLFSLAGQVGVCMLCRYRETEKYMNVGILTFLQSLIHQVCAEINTSSTP